MAATRTLRVESVILAGNVLGDPSARELPVYLPPGHDDGRRFPVVYVLAGFTSTGPSLLNHRGWGPTVPQQIDRLVRAGSIPPMIAVFPDCWTRWGGSQYLDSPATGRYMSHVVEELVPLVDRMLPTVPLPEARAVTGASSGGYGALMLAMERPGVFGLVAATAADAAFDLCYRPDLPRFVATIDGHGGVSRFLERFFATWSPKADQIGAMMVLAMAACYSPNLAVPDIFADLPVDLRTAELLPDVWERWLEKDPVRRVALRADALGALRLLSLDVGLRDEYHLQFGNRQLANALSRLGIPFAYEEFDDGHRGIGYRLDAALARIGEVIVTA